jgi:hypothetical protein
MGALPPELFIYKYKYFFLKKIVFMGYLYQLHIFIYMRCYIYQHRRLDNGEIFYIGRGTVSKKASGKCDNNTFRRAFNTHTHNKHWMRITSKYEWVVEILEDYLSWEQSNLLEIEYIKKYGRKDLNEGNLVNHTDGGGGSFGYIPSELNRLVQKKRMGSDLNPMKNKINRDKMSEYMKKSNPMKNSETQKKVSESLKQYWDKNAELHPRLGKKREDLRFVFRSAYINYILIG